MRYLQRATIILKNHSCTWLGNSQGMSETAGFICCPYCKTITNF